MSNIRPGVDDNPADYLYLVKVNVPFDDQTKLIAVFKEQDAIH